MERQTSTVRLEQLADSVETLISGGMASDKAVELVKWAFSLTDEDMKVLFAILKEHGLKDTFKDKHF